MNHSKRKYACLTKRNIFQFFFFFFFFLNPKQTNKQEWDLSLLKVLLHLREDENRKEEEEHEDQEEEDQQEEEQEE